jgi:hypothetical protein
VPTGIAPAALHAITPNEFRGQVTALYLFAINLIGMGFGPTFVALATDRVFQSDLAVGRSLALVTGMAAIVRCADRRRPARLWRRGCRPTAETLQSRIRHEEADQRSRASS